MYIPTFVRKFLLQCPLAAIFVTSGFFLAPHWSACPHYLSNMPSLTEMAVLRRITLRTTLIGEVLGAYQFLRDYFCKFIILLKLIIFPSVYFLL